MKQQLVKRAGKNEAGYALLALLAGMTITLVMLAAMAAKPTVRFETQRENEEEMMFRAVQVANAIQLYARFKGNGLTLQSLPTKLEDIAKEINVNGHELHLVRHSAMIDPLTNEEWKPVRLGDPVVKDFLRAYLPEMARQRALALASGNLTLVSELDKQKGRAMTLLEPAAKALGIDLNRLSSGKDDEDEKSGTASGFTLGGADSDSRPIIGVISKSKKQMIRNYFGVASYDKALFVSGIQPPTMSYQVTVIGGVPPVPNEGNTNGGPGAVFGQKRCPPGSTAQSCQ